MLEGDSTTHRESVYGMYAGGRRPGIRSITDGRFKLIKYDVDNTNTQVTQMFDLDTNPFELLPEHGTPNIAESPAYAAIRNQLEAEMMIERLRNNDPDPFLGDRTLFRFEDGNADDTPTVHLDEFAFSGTGGALPTLKTEVPAPTDFVLGDANTLSLGFEQDLQQYLQVPDSDRAINFGAVPFTIEAWVQLSSLPTSNNFAGTMPVAMKKVIGASDTEWHHISVAVDPANNTVRFTLDDQVDTQILNTFGRPNNGPLIIGAHFNSNSQIDSAFDGCIDEFSITDGFLSLGQIQPLTAVNDVTDQDIRELEVDRDNLGFNLTFSSDETRLYTLERSPTLESADWTEVEGFTLIPGANGTDLTPPTSFGCRSFRKRVL